jgi:filamentous hemagglutinin
LKADGDTLISRYGGPGGKFASPEGTPFDERSLPPDAINRPLNTYLVMQDIDVTEGLVEPWFGEPGLGVQYEFPNTIQWYLDNGYLEVYE